MTGSGANNRDVKKINRIPYIKSKYNEVNQNERKAENRCT